MTTEKVFDKLSKNCVFRAIQNDLNGDEVIHFCSHSENNDKYEGNCFLKTCPLLKDNKSN